MLQGLNDIPAILKCERKREKKADHLNLAIRKLVKN